MAKKGWSRPPMTRERLRNQFRSLIGNPFNVIVFITLILLFTLIIIPLSYPDIKTVLLSVICCAAGVAIAYGLSRLEGLKDAGEAPQEIGNENKQEN